jgi:hypothetical protein
VIAPLFVSAPAAGAPWHSDPAQHDVPADRGAEPGRDAGKAGRRFGKNFADEADKAASKSDLPDRLVRDVEKAAGDIEKAHAAEVKAAAAVETAEGRLAKARDKEANRKGSTARSNY